MTVVASNYARKENDLYQTEPWATEALLRCLPDLTSTVWEPAAGNHMIADVLRDRGMKVLTSDAKTYNREHDEELDFLNSRVAGYPKNMITNPPYGRGNRDAAKWARLALMRCPCWVALLLTAKFDFGKTRVDLFRDEPRFYAKVALLDRVQWFPGDHGGTEDHAWYVWGPAEYESPTIFWEGRE